MVIKLPGHGADHWPPSGAEVTAQWSGHCACHVCLMVRARITFPLLASVDCEGVLPC